MADEADQVQEIEERARAARLGGGLGEGRCEECGRLLVGDVCPCQGEE